MPNHRTIILRLLLPLLWLGTSFSAYAQRALELPKEIEWQHTMQQHIQHLASDSLEGRRAGTSGNLKAASYLADQFAQYGLIPLQGEGGEGFFHQFSYTIGIKADSGNSVTLIRTKGGKSDPVQLVPEEDFNPLGFSGAGRVQGDIVFAGYGISAPDLNYDDYSGINADGKIVLLLRHSPDGDNPHGEFARHASFAQKVITAREHGATGMIVINSPLNIDYPILPRLDRSFTNAGIVAVSTRGSVFGDLRDPKGRTIAQLQALIDSSRTPASFVVEGYRADIISSVSTIRAMIPNVVALLPGTDPKLREEFVVVGAHFDHLGRGGEGSLSRGDSAIHHGADDNASGTAALLVLAERYARFRSNPRSIIFVGFNAEEEGLLGSGSLVANPPFPLEKVVAMLNMDMIGRLDSNALVVYGIGTSPVWKGLVDSLNGENRFNLKLVEDGYGPSDHTSFYLKDIPVLFFFTGLHSDYHRPSDTWEKVNYPGAAQVASFVDDALDWTTRQRERMPFTKTQTSAARASTGFRVYVGTIPDYAYEGKGLRLSGVAEGGPAARAGLREGDVIIRMGPKAINNIYDYTYALGDFRPKEKVEVEFQREGKSMTTTVELASR